MRAGARARTCVCAFVCACVCARAPASGRPLPALPRRLRPTCDGASRSTVSRSHVLATLCLCIPFLLFFVFWFTSLSLSSPLSLSPSPSLSLSLSPSLSISLSLSLSPLSLSPSLSLPLSLSISLARCCSPRPAAGHPHIKSVRFVKGKPTMLRSNKHIEFKARPPLPQQLFWRWDWTVPSPAVMLVVLVADIGVAGDVGRREGCVGGRLVCLRDLSTHP